MGFRGPHPYPQTYPQALVKIVIQHWRRLPFINLLLRNAEMRINKGAPYGI